MFVEELVVRVIKDLLLETPKFFLLLFYNDFIPTYFLLF